MSSEEEKKDSLEDRKKDLSRELSEVALSIRNMFSRCQSTMKSKQILSNNRESSVLSEVMASNLEVIVARLVDLKEIKKEYSTESKYA